MVRIGRVLMVLVVMLMTMSMTPAGVSGQTSPIVATPSPGNGPFADGRIGRNFLGQVTVINVDQIIMAGDDSGPPGTTEIVYRGFAGFDTSAVPAGSVIQSVVLRLSLFNGTPNIGDVSVDLVNFGASLDASDYDAPALAPNITTFSATGPLNQYQDRDVTVATAAAVSLGTVQFRLRAQLEQSQSGQNLAFYNDIENFSGTGQTPQLVITLAPEVTTVLVADVSAGTGGRGALFRVDSTTGQRTVVSDFGNSAQGPLGRDPAGVAVEANGNILVSDVSAGTGFRGALFRVDPATGQRTVVSDFGNSAQGPLGVDPAGVAVD